MTRIEEVGAAPVPDQSAILGGESARPGETSREVQRLLDIVARVRGELAVAEVKMAAQERVIADAQQREEVWRDLIYQEKGEKKVLLERLPLAEVLKRGIWERLLGGGREK